MIAAAGAQPLSESIPGSPIGGTSALWVLVLTNLFPGGVVPARGAYVANQVDSLRRLGHQVEVVAIDGARSRWDYVRGVGRLHRALRSRRFDLVHAHYGYTGLVGRTQWRIPLVVSYLGSDVLWSRQRPFSRLAAHLADWGICMTRSMRDLLGVPRMTVIPNGTDLERFHTVPRDPARHALGWDPAETIAIFPWDPARPEKRFALAETAVAFARSLGARVSLVPFHGRSQEEYNAALNAADLCLLTSKWEGSPNAVRESLAVGLPVVSAPVGDAPEMLAGIAHCRVCAADPEELGKALSELDRLRRESGGVLRCPGRGRAAAFSLMSTAGKLDRLYRLLLAGVRDPERIEHEVEAAAFPEPDPELASVDHELDARTASGRPHAGAEPR